jgi:L-ornithine N5-oxygenase
LKTAKFPEEIFEFVGLGFGPSNLSLAVAVQELAPQLNGVFLEHNPEFYWHANMMFDRSNVQISFLKDLVTMRNPSSPFSFLNYVRDRGRMERFVNLRRFHPTREEYQDYLRWAAERCGADVRYGTKVLSVTPSPEAAPDHFEVCAEEIGSGTPSRFLARNVVIATGGVPRIPAGCEIGGRIMDAGQFLARLGDRFPDPDAPARFVVVGDGQSSGEVVLALLQTYRRADVHVCVSGYALRPADSSVFLNEIYRSSEVDAFYGSDQARRRAILQDVRNANYGVVDPDLLEEIYRTAYASEVRGLPRLHIRPFTRLTAAREEDDGVRLTIGDRLSGQGDEMTCDALVLATGFERRLDPDIFGPVLRLLKQREDGGVEVSRHYRALTREPLPCGVYLQGFNEASHGPGDTLLSLLPFRSAEIVEDIVAHRPAEPLPPPAVSEPAYPPRRHVGHDADRQYALIERNPFATLISARGRDDALVTQLPLILDRRRGRKGVLFGHMDRSNPQAALLNGREVLAVFHGPDCYISPHVYRSRQLPTWNSISVQVRGKVRPIEDRDTLVQGLQSICEHADPGAASYRLAHDDPRIDRLIDFIVGFEIEIDDMIGRFKLSQDRDTGDQQRAVSEMLRHARDQDRDLIEKIAGVDLSSTSRPAGKRQPVPSVDRFPGREQ